VIQKVREWYKQSNLGIADLPTGKAHGHCYSTPILLEMTSDDTEGVSRKFLYQIAGDT